MNRWGASSKCRNDLTFGIDPNAAKTTLSNVSCLVEETSNSYSILNAWRNYVRKSNGASRIASTLVCLIILLCFCSTRVDAASTPDDSNEQATRALTSSESLLLFDNSTPPEPYPPQFLKRAASTSSSAPSVSTASSDALPRPFDAGLGNNFTTSSCPIFFKQFLSDKTFNECVPLSFLLQTSTSFFTVQRSPVKLAQTLGASCGVNFDSCSTLMASLARQIQSPDNCAADLQNQNPTVMQAYTGFVAYQSLYHAGCLLNDDTGSYCFSDAVTNATSPTDSYVYYLPLGVSLPGTTSPSCSGCLQNTMSVFASAATNRSQPVSKVYTTAAAMIDLTCGAQFVNSSTPINPSTGAASIVSQGSRGLGSIALLLALVTVLI